MKLFLKVASVCMLCLASAWADAQPADAMPDEVAMDEPGVGAEEAEGDFRDLAGYLFPAISTTLRSMQLVSYAMVLRDYCADANVTDAFLRERLVWFSARTGREETCRTLLDY